MTRETVNTTTVYSADQAFDSQGKLDVVNKRVNKT